ncbi:MAG: polyprenyl synthetase family protein [Candidatus Omnitrophica bacterium]|nr:polyprenyl synthetase family protein [Candidatus Omnitrophota bacterium]
MKLESYLAERQTLVNRALERYLPPAGGYPQTIHKAMRYSVLGEGKRIRPILALAACEAVGGKLQKALPAACALEMIHAYSLVHDDLPAMDNDDFRRGKPSCHKKFGEAIGVLAGDALLTLSFSLLAGEDSKANGSASSHLRVIGEVARAIGTEGMIGGQVVDVASAGKPLSPALLEYINTRKTGALISAAVRVGGILGGADPKKALALKRYGEKIGLVFQLVDDLLDGDGAVRLRAKSEVRRRAERLTESAIEAVAPLKEKGEPLRALARFLLERGH